MVMKSSRQLERHLKGLANHWRLDILFFLDKKSEATLDELIAGLKGNQKTFSSHTGKLLQAGLLNKRYQGRNVLHSLSPYGKAFCGFLKTLQ